MVAIDFLIAGPIAVICGTIAQLTSGFSRGGWIVNLGVGFLGAVGGVVLSRALNAPLIYNIKYRMIDFPIIYSIIGCTLLLAGIGFLIKPHRR